MVVSKSEQTGSPCVGILASYAVNRGLGKLSNPSDERQQ